MPSPTKSIILTGLITPIRTIIPMIAALILKWLQQNLPGVRSIKLIAGGDPVFTDDNLRGRLNELDFIASMAGDVKAAMEMEDNKDHTEAVLNKLKGST